MGCFRRFWAIILRTVGVGVQVLLWDINVASRVPDCVQHLVRAVVEAVVFQQRLLKEDGGRRRSKHSTLYLETPLEVLLG